MASTHRRNGFSKPAQVTKNMTVREAAMVFNESVQSLGSILRGRQGLGTGMNPDPRRDIDKECGYLANPTTRDFKELYQRFGLAARIVNLLPDECHAVTADIYETERPRDTPFEKMWKALVSHPDLCPHYYLRKIDALSGIGRFGGLMIGTNDGRPLDAIAEGFKEDGTFADTLPKERRLLYLRALDESFIRVQDSDINNDPFSPRFRMPNYYEVATDLDPGTTSSTSPWRRVHWSRILHVAECRDTSSELYADSRLRKVNEPLWDIRKILGGSAEMFWKGGFPGIAATVDPRFIEAGGIDVDVETITDEMQRFMEGLQRYILGVGFQVNSLSPQVADPTAHLVMQFTVIAMIIGIPLRVLMGSEEAKLASGQDAKAWNKRIGKRQNDYLTPKVYRPFVNRLIGMGIMPPPKQRDQFGLPVFKVFWPDISLPDDNEKSTIADRRSAAILKYVTSQSWQLMQPSDFLRFVLGYNPEEIDHIIANAKKDKELPFADSQADKEAKLAGKVPPGKKKPADSGSKGTPPSDSPVGAIKQ